MERRGEGLKLERRGRRPDERRGHGLVLQWWCLLCKELKCVVGLVVERGGWVVWKIEREFE